MFKIWNFVYRMAYFFLIIGTSREYVSASEFERLDFGRCSYSNTGRNVEITERENGFFTASFRPDFIVETGEIFEEPRDVDLPGLVVINIDSPEVAGVAQSGKDTRIPVAEVSIGKNSKEWPFCVHARLNLQFDAGLGGGSATLIGPHHLITAGHNIDHERYGRVRGIEAIFGSEGKTRRTGSTADISAVYVHQKWLQRIDSDYRDYDMALLILNKSIGRSVGWYGLACLKDEYLGQLDNSIQLTITGYPKYVGRIGIPEQPGLPTDHLDFETDNIYNRYFSQMWTSSGGIDFCNDRTISYKIDTSGGQSGSGISYEVGEEKYVMAVHTNGGSGKNRGTLVRKDLMEEIVGIMNHTFSISSIGTTLAQSRSENIAESTASSLIGVEGRSNDVIEANNISAEGIRINENTIGLRATNATITAHGNVQAEGRGPVVAAVDGRGNSRIIIRGDVVAKSRR